VLVAFRPHSQPRYRGVRWPMTSPCNWKTLVTEIHPNSRTIPHQPFRWSQTLNGHAHQPNSRHLQTWSGRNNGRDRGRRFKLRLITAEPPTGYRGIRRAPIFPGQGTYRRPIQSLVTTLDTFSCPRRNPRSSDGHRPIQAGCLSKTPPIVVFHENIGSRARCHYSRRRNRRVFLPAALLAGPQSI
jgi:hypothetical protein